MSNLIPKSNMTKLEFKSGPKEKKSPQEEAMELAEDAEEGKIATKMLTAMSKTSGKGGAAAKALLSK